MDEKEPVEKQKNIFEKIAIVVLVIIFLVALTYFLINLFQTNHFFKTRYTTIYTNVTADAAYNLINENVNLKIIDCRGLEGCGPCAFKNEGHIKGADLNSNPETLYNCSDDILVYSVDGIVGASFCNDLINHVYGKIYNLEGGINAWKEKNFPIVYGNE